LPKTLDNLSTYIIILFLVGMLIAGVKFLGVELINNDNSILDNNSIDYIADINGVNLSYYDTSREDIDRPIYIKGNTTQGNPKDYSLEFQFAKEEGLSIENKIKAIYNTPDLLLFKILKLPRSDWDWIVNIVIWLFAISLTISLILFARGNKAK